MSASTEEIFISLKRNGFDISSLEVEEILRKLVEEGFIQREMPSVLEWIHGVLNSNDGVRTLTGILRYRHAVIKE